MSRAPRFADFLRMTEKGETNVPNAAFMHGLSNKPERENFTISGAESSPPATIISTLARKV